MVSKLAENKTEEKKEAKAPKKESKTALLQKQLDEQKDSYLRLAAEFDNFKRREAQKQESLGEYVKAQTVKALIGAIDGFDRVMSADSASADFAKGVEMTIKGFKETLTQLGLQEIDPKGEPFDANYHQAVMRVDDDTLEENTVVEVFQKGYKVGDILLRPAMVSVAGN